jgi:hypothetical protein
MQSNKRLHKTSQQKETTRYEGAHQRTGAEPCNLPSPDDDMAR